MKQYSLYHSLKYAIDDRNIEYFFDMQLNMNSKKIFASMSDNHIYIIDHDNLSVLRRFKSHLDRINCIEASSYSPDILLSGADDNFAKIWDIRTENPVMSIGLEDNVTGLSLGVEGNLLAVGFGSSLDFFDIRSVSSNKSNCLGTYSDIHTDLITQVKFHKNNDALVISAAEDGLICIMDTSVRAGEEAVVSILNTECPVRKFGFFGCDNDGLYCLSNVETLSLWHYPSAQRIYNLSTIREDFQVDYLVDCFCDTDNVNLVAGCYNGDGVVLSVQPNGLKVASSLMKGHQSQIRCICNDNHLYSGDENSTICMWKLDEIPQYTNKPVTGYNNDNRKTKDIRYKPY